MKATKVDGVYDSDPAKNPDAERFDHVSYMEVLQRRAQRHGRHRDVAVHGQRRPDDRVSTSPSQANIQAALRGQDVGTTID